MIRLISLIVLGLAFSCSSTKNSKNSTEKPDWVNSPEANCSKEYICAVGSGSGLNASYADARAEIAKQFTANVKAKHVSSLTSENYKISESTFDEVEESTNEVISGVNIKESWEDSENYYSYARLNRKAAGKLLQTQIKTIDNEINELFKKQSFAMIVKIMPLFQKRELLNSKYNFITNNSVNSKYSFDRLANSLNDLKNTYRLKIEASDSAPGALVSKIKGYFGKNGIKLVEDNSFTHSVDLKFHSSKQFLKVKGFEKYQFVVDIKAQKNQSPKSQVISFKEYIVARDFNDCLAQALVQIDEFIDEKIYKLGL